MKKTLWISLILGVSVLLANVKEGRAVDDPLNTTGAAMPPKGGFAFLTDSDINSIIAIVRSIEE